MISDLDIRERLIDYLVEQTTLDEFEDWLVQNTWNVHQWGSEATQNLAYSIEGPLAEHSGGQMDESDLRKKLVKLVREFVHTPIGDQRLFVTSTSTSTISFTQATFGRPFGTRPSAVYV